MRSVKKKFDGIVSLGVALTFVSTSLVAGVTPVATAEVVTGNVQNLSPDTIDRSRTVDLTLHKSKPNPFDDVPEGELPKGGVSGAVFTLERLGGYDLDDPEVWKSFKSLDLEDVQDAQVEARFSGITDQDGNAIFTGLPQGLYRVSETPPDDPTKDFRVSSPFLLTLPVANEDGSGWAYSVVVSPKKKPDDVNPPGSSGSTVIPIPIPIPVPVPGGGSSDGSTGTGTEQPVPAPENPAPPKKGVAKYLPDTGADVLVFLGLGLVFMLMGMMLLARRRSRHM